MAVLIQSASWKWLQLATICLFLCSSCLGSKLFENILITDTSTTAITEGNSVQGTVGHREYVYYKFVVSYPTLSDKDIVDNSRLGSRVGINISQGERERDVILTEGKRVKEEEDDSTYKSKSIKTLSLDLDPYDPSDPAKNSIRFYLQSISGDADLCSTCSLTATGDSTGTPSLLPGHFNFSSTRYSDDFISISADYPLNCARAGRSGVFYIGITGASDGQNTFSLTALKYGGLRTVIPGMAIKGKVLAGLGDLYRFQLPYTTAQQVRITVTPILGDVDLFVKLGKTNPKTKINSQWYSALNINSVMETDSSIGIEIESDSTVLRSFDSESGSESGSGSGSPSDEAPYDPATRTHYDYMSTDLYSSADTVTVSEADMASCAASHCWVSILVDGYSTADYTLLVTLQDTVIQLQDGVPQHSSVTEGGFQYFTLPVGANGTVAAIVTVFSGTPTVYLSTTDTMPNSTSIVGVVSSDGSTSGNIPYVHLHATVRTDGSGSGSGPTLVYIGVGGGDRESDFSIRASLERDGVVGEKAAVVLYRLLNGVPQSDVIPFVSPPSVSESYWRYYIFPVSAGHETLSLRQTTAVGSVYIFVSKCSSQHPEECAAGALPNATHTIIETWGQITSNIDITRQDDTACSYILGVYTGSQYTAYQLSVTLQDSILALTAGTSVTDEVSQGGFDYFSFYLHGTDMTLRVALLVLSGDADLYISKTVTHPNIENSTWQSNNYESDFISISPDDPHYCTECLYYIAVRGFRQSSYKLTAFVKADNKLLSDGVSFTDSVDDLSSTSYVFEYSEKSKGDVRITLAGEFRTPGAYLLVYVSLDNVIPSSVHFTYTAVSESDIPYAIINIRQSDTDFNANCLTGCRVRILVMSGLSGGDYDITVVTASSATLLVWGTLQRGWVVSGSDVGYRAILSNPSPSRSHAVSDSYPRDRDFQSLVPLEREGGFDSSSSSSSDQTIRLTVNQFNGHITAYVSCSHSQSQSIAKPNATNHIWKLKGDDNHFLDISFTSASDRGCFNGPSGSAQLLVTVHGDTSASYSIMLSLLNANSSAPLLSPGTPTVGTVGDHLFQYYTVRPGNEQSDLSVTAIVLKGDVDLYISESWAGRPILRSQGQGPPGSAPVINFNYSSNSVGTATEEIIVPWTAISTLCKNREKNCYLLIGVYGSDSQASASQSSVSVIGGAVSRLGGGGFVSDTESAFMIQVSYGNSIITLVNGIPVKGHCNPYAGQYYQYTVSEPKTDLVISVSPLVGDPDLYVSFYPLTHPNRTHYSFIAASSKGDTLTLQSSMMAPYCVPDPATGKTCDVYIGVLAFRNTTFTLTATLSEGFKSRISLIDGQPQTGVVNVSQYVYYEYNVRATIGEPLRFSLSSLNSMDLDLYLTFRNTSSTGNSDSDNNTPGRSRYDFKSTNMGGDSDVIEVYPSDPLYCMECTVYLAVYAFTSTEEKGEYVLTGSSGRIEEIPMNQIVSGSVRKGSYRYYTFRNEDALAHITIGLTVRSADGDADLCVSTYKANSNSNSNTVSGTSDSILDGTYLGPSVSVSGIALPTMKTAIWKSLRFGDDSVRIDYDDPNFCYNCDYIVGVNGFQNASYWIVVTAQDDLVTKLAPNIALEVSSAVGAVQYFSTGALNSADDILFSVTPLDTGTQDLFVQVYRNDSISSRGVVHLNVSDPRSYKYTTEGTQDTSIKVKGPFTQGATFVVAVRAKSVSLSVSSPAVHSQSQSQSQVVAAESRTRTRYTVLASYSQQHVLLTIGVPQNHFVSKGDTEYFRFIPQTDTDISITLTARSGDPDMLVSSDFEFPHCVGRVCSNYTWASTSYSSDQIILSKDYPCQAVLPSTSVSKTCNVSTSYQPGKHKAINIGVFGYYKNTVFSILVTPVGEHYQLTEGVSVTSSASVAFECPVRDEVTGLCTAEMRQVRAAYFSFIVIPSMADGEERDSTVIITVQPTCNSSYVALAASPTLSLSDYSKKDRPCPAGCDCSPLRVYITSCMLGNCTAIDRRPSGLPGQSGASFLVAQTGSSFTLSARNPSNHIMSNKYRYSPSVIGASNIGDINDDLTGTDDNTDTDTDTDTDIGDINDDLTGTDDNTDTDADKDISRYTKVNKGKLAVGVRVPSGYCNPWTSKGTCVYYVAVVSESSPVSKTPPVFQISAQTPSSVKLVPCESPSQASPDGVRTMGVVKASSSSASSSSSSIAPKRYYEVCPSSTATDQAQSQTSLSLVVTIEQCSGHTDIYACDTTGDSSNSDGSGVGRGPCIPGSLPSIASWAQRSDGNQTCTRQWTNGGLSKDVCTAVPRYQRRPTLILPYNITNEGVSAGSNYYLMTSGEGDYVLSMESGVLGSGNTRRAPQLVQDSLDGKGDQVVIVGSSSVTSKEKESVAVTGPLSLSWLPSSVQMGSVLTDHTLIKYTAHIVDIAAVSADRAAVAVLNTQCGLQKVKDSYPSGAVRVVPLDDVRSANQPNGVRLTGRNTRGLMESPAPVIFLHTFDDSDIPSNKDLSITIVATCNGHCLRSISEGNPSAFLCASSSVDCKPQVFVYSPVMIRSSYSPVPSSSTWIGTLLSLTSWVVLIAVLFMIAVGGKIMYERQYADPYTVGQGELATPYVDNLGGNNNNNRFWSTWGYSKLGFTEMVDTSTFSRNPGLDLGDSAGSGSSAFSSDSNSNSNSNIRPGRSGQSTSSSTAKWLYGVTEGANGLMVSGIALSRTAALAVSDTTSGAFSYFNMNIRRPTVETDVDRSTHSLTRASRQDGETSSTSSSMYRPPSPVPFTPLSQRNVDLQTSIAMTDRDRVDRERDAESGPIYTSFPSQKPSVEESKGRGREGLLGNIEDEEEEED